MTTESTLLRGSGARRLEEKENVLPFKRRRGKVHISRRSPLRQWLEPFAKALLIVTIPTAAVAWLMTAPQFALQEIRVETGDRVSERWVRQALRPLIGRNLPLISLEEADSLVRRHPWLRGCDLRKNLPSGLTVQVTEKRAVALLREGRDLHYLDARGERITGFDPATEAADLLLISRAQAVMDLQPAVQMVEEIERVAPPWSAGLSEIEVVGERDFRLHTTELPFPLLVRAGTLAEKSSRLEELLPSIRGRYGALAAIDLRFARRIIVQPAGSRPRASSAKSGKATADHA